MRLVPMTQNGQITEFEREKEILGETWLNSIINMI